MKKNELARALDMPGTDLTREVHEHPLTCVGLALGVGVVLGALGAHRPPGTEVRSKTWWPGWAIISTTPANGSPTWGPGPPMNCDRRPTKLLPPRGH